MTVVSSHQARQNFAEIVELAYYKDKKIRVERKGKPMAWVVGDPFMKALGKIMDKMQKIDPSLTETMEIVMDENIMNAIKMGNSEVKQGKTISIDEV